MFQLGTWIEEHLRQLQAGAVTDWVVLTLLVVFGLALVAARRGAFPGFVHYTPNLLTSLGILGTFVGIVIGLLDFNVDDIDGSIGPLLEGLKTAFITSLSGMALAIVFKTLDSSGRLRPRVEGVTEEEVGPAEIFQELRLQRFATERLIRAIEGDEDSTLISQVRLLRSDGQEQSRAAMEQLKAQGERLQAMADAQERMRQAVAGEEDGSLVGQVRQLHSDSREHFRAVLGENKAQTERQIVMSRTLERLRSAIAGDEDSSLVSQLKLLRSEGQEQSKAAMEQLRKQSERQLAMSLALDQHKERLGAFEDRLWQKLDQFAEILSKSATEAVITALKEVIADFNRNLTEQFGENFKELNAAVGKLVQWQENYKEQLQDMHRQYEQGVQAITTTQDAVSHISEESKQIPVAMGELKTVLETTQHQLNELERHLEAFKDMRDRAVEAVPQIREQMNGMVKEVAAATKDAGARILAGTEAANAAMTRGAEDFSQKIGASLDGMVKDVSTAVRDAGEQIASGSQNANQAIIQGAEEFKNNVNRTNQGLVSASDQLANNSEKIREQLEATVSDINENVRNMVNGLVEQAKAIGTTLVESNKKLQTDTKKVEGQVTDSIEKMQKRLESALDEVFQAQTREMNKFSSAMEDEIRKSVGTTGQAVNEQLKAMDTAMQREVERVMNEMGRALATITGQFTTDYAKLVRAMDDVVRTQAGQRRATNR